MKINFYNKMITELNDKKKNNRLRQSLFLLTINTNKTFNCVDKCKLERLPLIKQKLITLLEDLLSKKNILKLTLDLGPVGSNERKQINPDKVKNIEVRSQIEANLKGAGFLHSHSLIEITHDTRVQLDLLLMKNIIYKYLQKVLTFDGKFSKPYINLRATKSQEFAMQNYVSEGTEVEKII